MIATRSLLSVGSYFLTEASRYSEKDIEYQIKADILSDSRNQFESQLKLTQQLMSDWLRDMRNGIFDHMHHNFAIDY